MATPSGLQLTLVVAQRDLVAYLPIATALIALAGVVITLAWTTHRDRRASRLERTDEYRQQMRLAIADVLSSGHELKRHLRMVGGLEPQPADEFDERQFVKHRERVDDVIHQFRRDLIRAHLLAQERTLHLHLDAVEAAGRAVRDSVVDSMGLPASEHPDERGASLDRQSVAWEVFDKAMDDLAEDGFGILRPTVFDET